DSVGEWEYDFGRNTRPANVTRLPAITLPGGSDDGLPIGLQLVGEAFRDDELLGIAATLESLLE
ncbi:MAG: amidase family protein, partial [Natronomonas sp.]